MNTYLPLLAVIAILLCCVLLFLRSLVRQPDPMERARRIERAWTERELIRGSIQHCSAREREQYAGRIAELNTELRHLGVPRESLEL